jgi:hypothetical protein
MTAVVAFFEREEENGAGTGTYQKKGNSITIKFDEGKSFDIKLKNGVLSIIDDLLSYDDYYKKEGFTKCVVMHNYKKSS